MRQLVIGIVMVAGCGRLHFEAHGDGGIGETRVFAVAGVDTFVVPPQVTRVTIKAWGAGGGGGGGGAPPGGPGGPGAGGGWARASVIVTPGDVLSIERPRWYRR